MYQSMGQIVLLGLAGLIAGWIVLGIMGGERERQLQHVDAARRAAHAAASALAAEVLRKSPAGPALPQPPQPAR